MNETASDPQRRNAEEVLEQVRRQAGAGARGRQRIYLGMAPGVGKTFAALQELHRRAERGTDVVIGCVETYGRPKTVEAVGDLPLVPLRQVAYKGVTLSELDVDGLIARRPAVCLVDELAHTNAPGSRNAKRWQDVEDLLAAGITVISTLNIQHVESLADIVETITGVQVRERVPDAVVDNADELEIVDISPHALRQRMRHGNIYPPERAEQALHQFFREGNLTALRELALRRVATTVEQDLEAYLRDHQVGEVWPADERVLVCVDATPFSRQVIRRAWTLASRARAPLLAVFVETPAWAGAAPETKRALEENLLLAEDLGGECVRVAAANVAQGVAQVARNRNVGTVVLGARRHTGLISWWHRPLEQRLVQARLTADLHVVPLA